MSVDHEEHISPRRENYLSRSIDDFTDCVDFTNQYQKSCLIGGNDIDSDASISDKDCFQSDGKRNEVERVGHDSEVEKDGSNSIDENFDDILGSGFDASFENSFEDSFAMGVDSPGELLPDPRTMEPDVTITVGTTSLSKCLSQSAMGTDDGEVFDTNVSGSVKSRVTKKKSVYGKKNFSKLPMNKNTKKKASVLKYKTGKHTKQKSEQSQQQNQTQSDIRFKCYKCSLSSFTSLAELQMHQRKCNTTSPEFQSANDSTQASSSHPSNVRITRKVYLCSACGSYYENWNLFLHMKEMHRRHICLFCLGMFSQTDKLAHHLITKHNVVEQNLSTTDDFYRLYRGTCYLICCSCETMFSEKEEFAEHSCKVIPRDSSHCPLCGIQGGHHPTCRRFQMYRDRRVEPKVNKPHSGLEKRLYNKKKKLKPNKKTKNVFKIVSNDKEGKMSMTVRKQTSADERPGSSRGTSCTKTQSGDTSPVRLSVDDLVSTKQFNEKMLQLYRPNRSAEKVTSSIKSIEESINRVVENLGYNEDDEEEEGEDLEESTAQDTVIVTAGSVVEEEEEEEKEEEEEEEKEGKEVEEEEKEEEVEEEEEKEEEEAKPEPKKKTKSSKGEIASSTEKKRKSGHGARNVRTRRLSAKNEKEALSDNESTGSDKLTIATDQSSEAAKDKNDKLENAETLEQLEDVILSAGPDTPYMHVTLKKEYTDEKDLIKELVKESSWNCVYCAHAKRIAVNGKQLSLHILAEHRFVTCPEEASEDVKSESASSIVERLKNNLARLEECYFNTDTFDSGDRSIWKPNDKLYECFHCLFATYIHKELYSHNRKMHQKAVFLCIMCKSNFYNYSELLCHLCPGIYIPGQVINPDITYRCFLCNVDPLPSSFRLMVHLRRQHNSCDICFDQSSNQFQLSTHVWKHKISHMCYRCGIAYRNKPDITKHLFWKHGTESVLCKKCLQKKWPHVYHFCVPPNSFICDECSFSLKSAVALKVHKRIHTGEYPYSCDKCEEKFISRKLLVKHMNKHEQEQPVAEVSSQEVEEKDVVVDDANQDKAGFNGVELEKKNEKEKKSKKRKVLTDVFDLPPVNLSESDDSDQDFPSNPKIIRQKSPEPEGLTISNGFLNDQPENEDSASAQVVDGVWNNFKNYMDRKEFPKTFRPASPFKNMSLSRIKAIMLSDHDYHIIPNSNKDLKSEAEKAEEKAKVGLDHDYCNSNGNNNDKVNRNGNANYNGNENDNDKKSNVDAKPSGKSEIKMSNKLAGSKSSSSESSSDSDSSCSCGSNCSCSSGSSSSSSSNESDSDSREKRKVKKKTAKDTKALKAELEQSQDIDISVHDLSNEKTIMESDLDTEETETDEDFYDYNPAREANRVLAEKRTQLLANLNGSEANKKSPPTPVVKPQVQTKKTPVKKTRSQSCATTKPKVGRKKTPKSPAGAKNVPGTNASKKKTKANGIFTTPPKPEEKPQCSTEGEGSRPKRKRIPLKFYGFSSDDESETPTVSRKREKAEHNTTIPAQRTSDSVARVSAAVPSTSSQKSSPTVKAEKTENVQLRVNPIKIKTSFKQGTTYFGRSDKKGDFHIKKSEKHGSSSGSGSSAVASSSSATSSSGQKGEKLYCFCQCPYDEVSEMIACDAKDCVIEWFHFECVGIMVPPKGSWYCPDCRKKLAAENEFLSPSANDQNGN